jgi:hypothetical protein
MLGTVFGRRESSSSSVRRAGIQYGGLVIQQMQSLDQHAKDWAHVLGQ